MPTQPHTVAHNATWLVAERVLTVTVNLLVAVWLARYLGPDKFGIFNYAIAFVALFECFTYLGLDGIVTQALVRDGRRRGEIVGTTMFLRLLGGITAIAIIATITNILRVPSAEQVLILIVSVGLVFNSFTTWDFWFQARGRAPAAATARAAAVLAAAALKIGLIASEASLLMFAIATVVQTALQAAFLTVVCRREGFRPEECYIRLTLGVDLLRRAWPLIISKAGALVYLKLDLVMLGALIGAREVGIYAVAVRFSEIWYFIPTAIAASLFPELIKSKAVEEESYRAVLQRAYTTVAWTAIGIALAMTLTARPLIRLLYGDEYLAAADILMVHVWACPAVFMGQILSKWLIIENLLIFSLTRHLMGAAVNVGLNLLLIPYFGGLGAALATVISYSAASYLACFTDRQTRAAGTMMTAALLLPLTAVNGRLAKQPVSN